MPRGRGRGKGGRGKGKHDARHPEKITSLSLLLDGPAQRVRDFSPKNLIENFTLKNPEIIKHNFSGGKFFYPKTLGRKQASDSKPLL